MTSKQQILSLLDQAEDVVSGETLSQQLGISRVSVWKHIKGLVANGHPITATPRGYRLERDPDCLLPWNFGPRRELVHHFQELSSTMDKAAEMARAGCPDFSVVIAERQHRGRGRMQRTWSSADGGLYFSVVIRPDLPLPLAGLVNLAAAVDMAGLLRDTYGIDARLKWPNDILVDARKICGILSQLEAEGDRVGHVNIGIGLNVNNAPAPADSNATAVKSLLGRAVPRRDILAGFLDRFEARIAAFDPAAVIDQWKADNITLGRDVRVATINDSVEGTAVDIDAHGGLVLQLADGRRRTVVYGDCFHR